MLNEISLAALIRMIEIRETTIQALGMPRLLAILEMSSLPSEINFVAIVANVLVINLCAMVVFLFKKDLEALNASFPSYMVVPLARSEVPDLVQDDSHRVNFQVLGAGCQTLKI